MSDRQFQKRAVIAKVACDRLNKLLEESVSSLFPTEDLLFKLRERQRELDFHMRRLDQSHKRRAKKLKALQKKHLSRPNQETHSTI